MAIIIRCSECQKKISVDEAFTGSMCRCPYCKAIVSVPESGQRSATARPAAPSPRPDRPGAPKPGTPRPGQPAQHASGVSERSADSAKRAQHVAMAKPVRVQGIFTLVLIGLLVLVLAGLAWAVVAMVSSVGEGQPHQGPVPQAPRDPNAPPPPSRVNPLAAGGSSVVAGDIAVRPPVVYVVDAGGAMRPTIGFAAVMVYRSVASLPQSARVQLLVMKDASSQGLVQPIEGSPTGGKAAAKRMLTVLDTTYPGGTTDAVIPPAIESAGKLGAKTVVLLTRGPIDDPKATAAMKSWASESGRQLVLISIGSRPGDAKMLEDLAGQTGATFRSYDEYQLRDFLDESPLEE